MNVLKNALYITYTIYRHNLRNNRMFQVSTLKCIDLQHNIIKSFKKIYIFQLNIRFCKKLVI